MSNKKKMEVLYFVEQYIKRYGYPPTVRDMPKRIEQANKEYFNQAENLLATGIIPKKRGEKTGK